MTTTDPVSITAGRLEHAIGAPDGIDVATLAAEIVGDLRVAGHLIVAPTAPGTTVIPDPASAGTAAPRPAPSSIVCEGVAEAYMASPAEPVTNLSDPDDATGVCPFVGRPVLADGVVGTEEMRCGNVAGHSALRPHRSLSGYALTDRPATETP